MKIIVKLEPSQLSSTITVEPIDLGLEEEWETMSEESKHEAIRDYVENLPEQPYWMIDKIKYS